MTFADIEKKAMIAWFIGFSTLMLLMVVEMGSSGAAEQASAKASNLLLVDYTCGDGMHFDFKQGCVTDAPKLKRKMIRDRERKVRRSVERTAQLGFSQTIVA